jgi:uncharacterized membrane protein
MQEKRDILAVQTFRNWIMASSFLASVAILITLGMVNLAVRLDSVSGIVHVLNLVGSRTGTFWMIKIVVLIITFFSVFFNFTLSIRYLNHANYIINISPEDEEIVTVESVTRILNRGSLHYMLGMRGFFWAVPFTLWLFGPLLMFASTLVLVPILYKLDHTV